MYDNRFPEAHGYTIIPGQRFKASVADVLAAEGSDFVSARAKKLTLGWGGIEGDFHNGMTRKSGGREPWYERGTEMRNERQITIVSPDDLALTAERMGIREIRPQWIGANLVLEGIGHLSMLPRGTLLFFAGGVTLKVDDQNGPCKIAGEKVAIGAGMEDVQAGALLFSKAARRLRGLTAWVERPGAIAAGEELTVMVPEQWIWQG